VDEVKWKMQKVVEAEINHGDIAEL